MSDSDGIRARSTQSDRVRRVRADRIAANRRGWDDRAARYQQAVGGRDMYAGRIHWGPNKFDDEHLGVIGDVAGLEVLEIGCGAAQFGIELARRGARMTGIDLSGEQILHGRANVKAAGVKMRLITGNAEKLRARFGEGTFDAVVSDFAAGFMDLDLLLPEIAAVLRPGGFVALAWTSPILDCMTGAGEPPLLAFKYSYFDRTPWVDGGRDATFEFKRTYGDWVRAFARAGLMLEDLVEPQAPRGAPHMEWGNFRWERTSMVPGTCIWKARKPDKPTRRRA
ncbi:MAG TPA: class I SAM-dependent methyltransferase [Actinomycetota bacterium]|nr:class I SAM-dependent methyltransferase [Actinomycetota bacterium]